MHQGCLGHWKSETRCSKNLDPRMSLTYALRAINFHPYAARIEINRSFPVLYSIISLKPERCPIRRWCTFSSALCTQHIHHFFFIFFYQLVILTPCYFEHKLIHAALQWWPIAGALVFISLRRTVADEQDERWHLRKDRKKKKKKEEAVAGEEAVCKSFRLVYPGKDDAPRQLITATAEGKPVGVRGTRWHFQLSLTKPG